MKILVAEKLSGHRYKTPEGYLICVDSILARTGKQTYRRSEIFGDSENDGLIEVDRKAEEVFSPETMASFENKPICVEHPDVDVNSGNISEFAVGFVRDIHKGEYEGEPVMLGTLVITDAKTIEEIEEGKHTDLSCGYDCDIDDSENPQQRNIRGNHVALCEQGRAGIARIMDSVKDEESTYTEVTKNLEKETKKDMSWLDTVVKDSKRITDFDDAPRNVRVVKEFIEKNGNKFSKSKDADKILDYIKMKTGIRNADYGDVMYIIKNYTRATINDEATEEIKDYDKSYIGKLFGPVAAKFDAVLKYETSNGKGIAYFKPKSKVNSYEFAKGLENELRSRGWIATGWDNGYYRFVSEKLRFDSVKDTEQLYAVEFVYDGDSWSDYLGHVNVRAKSEQDALTKAKRWAVNRYDNACCFKIASTKYTNVETIDFIKDAKTEYVFNYHDTYHGTRDKMRVDANNLDEAIREFGKTMALGGFGTANIYVVSVSPNDGYMRAYGKLSEMLKQKWTRDSVKDSRYKVEYLSSGAEMYPIVEVDAASEFEAVETVRKKDKKYIRLISVKKKDSVKKLDSEKLLSIVRAVKSIKSNDAKETKLTFTPTNDVINFDMTSALVGKLASSGIDYHSAKENAGKYSVVIIGDNSAVRKAKLIIENIGFFSKWS